MGSLIAQSTVLLLIAAAAGILIGYFLKQVLAGRAADQMETMWSKKVRRASRELDTLRADLKAQTQRTEDVERMADGELDRVKSARAEVASEKEQTARMAEAIAEKQARIAFLDGLVAEGKAKLVAAVGEAASSEDIMREKTAAIESLTLDVDRAAKESIAKDLSLETLAARVADLEPIPGKLAASLKVIEGWEAKYKSLEAAKNGEIASLKSRVATLEHLNAKIREWEARYTSMLKEKDSMLARLTASVAALEPFKNKVDAAAKAAIQQDALVQGLRARAADAEPLEHRLRAADEEIGRLRKRAEELEAALKRSLTTDAEHQALIQELRARAADAVPFERKLPDAEEEVRKENHLNGRAALGSHAGQKDEEISRLGALLTEKDAELERHRAKNSDADDLKKIKGIGRALERQLNEYGVHSFKQIALWSKPDILAFEQRLPRVQNRVERDQWIAAAREEHLKKYNEHL